MSAALAAFKAKRRAAAPRRKAETIGSLSGRVFVLETKVDAMLRSANRALSTLRNRMDVVEIKAIDQQNALATLRVQAMQPQ